MTLSTDEAAFRKAFGHSSLCSCIRKWCGKYIVTRRECNCKSDIGSKNLMGPSKFDGGVKKK